MSPHRRGFQQLVKGTEVPPVAPSLLNHSTVPVGSRAGAGADRGILNSKSDLSLLHPEPSCDTLGRKGGGSMPPLEAELTVVTHW